MEKIRILHILSDTNIGGAGRLLYNLSECIDKNKFEFIYVFPKGSDLIDVFKGSKIYCISGGCDRSFDPSAIREVKKIISIAQPHIIHTHSALFARIGARLGGFSKERVVYTKHCVFNIPKIAKYRVFKSIYKLIDNALAGHIIAVAESAKKELIAYGVDERKIQVIINGVQPLRESTNYEKNMLREKLNIAKSSLIVGISARLESYKGHKTLIKSAEILKQKGINNVVFLILGDGSYYEELKKYSEKLNVSDRILFLGFKQNIAEYVNIFDINVNCSTGTETSSLAISEGLSLSKPAIVSDFGGNPNMVKNGETGYVVKQNDAYSLADKIIYLKNNPAILKYMSQNAKIDFFERFSADIMSCQYESFYLSLMER